MAHCRKGESPLQRSRLTDVSYQNNFFTSTNIVVTQKKILILSKSLQFYLFLLCLTMKQVFAGKTFKNSLSCFIFVVIIDYKQ